MMQRRVEIAAIFVIAAGWGHGAAHAQAGGRTVWDGVYTAAQADRGKGGYAGSCASCHGRNLEGGHIFGSRTRSAPALRGETFLSKWNGLSAGELFVRVSTNMPLDHPGSLSDDANADIVAFMMQANGFPAGGRDLPSDVEVMKTILITSQK
jgi:quinoprotein glucose dehydrogenase